MTRVRAYAGRWPRCAEISAAVRRTLSLRRVRAAGFAINNEELAYGLRSIAAPVLAHDGEVAGAINLAAHRSMVSMQDLVARLGPPLQRTAAEVSGRIGYRAAAR